MANPELDKFVEHRSEPTGIVLELEVAEVNTILAALGELPHRVSDQLIRKVFEQANRQANKQAN